MKLYMHVFLIIWLNIFIPTIVNAESKYEMFHKELTLIFENIKKNKSIINGQEILSKKVINDVWYQRSNQKLHDAGQDLIVFLKENRSVYQQLDFKEWQLATKDLLMVDSSLSQYIGWGNLVIKIAICNRVLDGIVGYLHPDKKISDEENKDLLYIIKQLRQHIPSEQAMYHIALRYYQLDSPFQVKTLNYEDINSPNNSDEIVRKKIREYYYKNKDRRISIEKLMNDEIKIVKTRMISDYQELYVTPIPLYLARTSQYHNLLWDLYIHISAKINIGNKYFDWSVISEKVILAILEKEYKSKDIFWITKYYREYFEYKDATEPNIMQARDRLLKYFRESKAIKLLSANNKRIKSGQPKTNVHISGFSVHNLP